MDKETEQFIRRKITWSELPPYIKQRLGDSQKEYEKIIVKFSIKHQLRYRGNLVKGILKLEERYYERLVEFSKERLMLFPYHLADMICKGLRITPFSYYLSMVEKLLQSEKNYDHLPNFTAVDCLRLLGIGRNEYIEIMNKSRSSKGMLFGRRNIRGFLPEIPCEIDIKPWWRVEVGLILEDDIKILNDEERNILDKLIDFGSQTAGELDYYIVQSLYRKGFIYLDVPITAVDRIQVPPLQGFVMNRILGDYFETLLYKIFVSIDQHITVGELADVLQVETEQVKEAVSLYCRLGFAIKLDAETSMSQEKTHPSWNNLSTNAARRTLLTPLTVGQNMSEIKSSLPSHIDSPKSNSPVSGEFQVGERIAFFFDSTLTAFLMMGNLSPGLKDHAVTMFEVGKLSDEILDSFLCELERVSVLDAEGEAQRYFDHAVILRSTVLALRKLERDGLDLVRLESLHSLDTNTCTRLLNKRYKLLVSMAPLSHEVRPVSSYLPPHLGPAVPEVNSLWFKLFLYDITGYGPPSLLLVKGTVLQNLPRIFLGYSRLLVTTWNHEPTILNTANLHHINSALKYSPVLIQAYGVLQTARTLLVPFPISDFISKGQGDEQSVLNWKQHPAICNLEELIDLKHGCGYLTMVNIGVRDVGCENRNSQIYLRQQKNLAETKKHAKLPSEEIILGSKVTTTICNENFQLPKEIQIRALENKTHEVQSTKSEETREETLQSPVETHFAVTPVNASETPSPANGFTSYDCTDILCQELDKLDQEHILSVTKSKSTESVENTVELKLETISSVDLLMSPIEESVSMFTRENETCKIIEEKMPFDDVKKDDKYNGEIWTLLDCCFGVPLFDVDANTKIIHSIVYGGLAEAESLHIWSESSRELGNMLLEFISRWQRKPGDNLGVVKRGRTITRPRRNLVFDNGQVMNWSGK